MHYFSTLFWYTTLYVSDRLTVHHQGFGYCIHSKWYLSYSLCWLFYYTNISRCTVLWISNAIFYALIYKSI